MRKPAQTNLPLVLLAALMPFWKAAAQENPLQMRWGLESSYYFEEIQANANGNSAIVSEVDSTKPVYRFFTPTNAHTEALTGWILPKVRRAQAQFENTPAARQAGTKVAGKDERAVMLDRNKAFMAFLKKEDPLTTVDLKELAPKLYFRFSGMKDAQYVLEEIEIETIRFKEYLGAGFFDKHAWYDILLCHAEGVKKHEVQSALRFDGSGSCVLRFWSDNFKENSEAPMGCYDIDIKFHFQANGKRVTVSTGRFKIDV